MDQLQYASIWNKGAALGVKYLVLITQKFTQDISIIVIGLTYKH